MTNINAKGRVLIAAVDREDALVLDDCAEHMGRPRTRLARGHERHVLDECHLHVLYVLIRLVVDVLEMNKQRSVYVGPAVRLGRQRLRRGKGPPWPHVRRG